MEWIMASEKARYWMAVGVAALFLSNSVVGGPSDWALRLADRSTATAQRISSQAMRYAVVAQVIFGRSELVLSKLKTPQLMPRLALPSCKQRWPTAKLR